MALVVKNPPAKAGDLRDVDSVPGWGRYSGGGHASHPNILPGESHRQRSHRCIVHRSIGCKESDTSEVT